MKPLPLRGKHFAFPALILAIVSIVFFFGMDVRSHVITFLGWLEAQGIWAPILFILIDAVMVVLLLPGLLMTMGAGFMFGVVMGGVCVISGTSIGALTAFLLGRQLAGTSYSRYFLEDQRLQLLGEAFMKRRGWGIVLLTRLIPFFPFKLSNYFFGIIGYSIPDFLLGTVPGIMPISFCNAYVGSLAADLAMLGTPRGARSPVEWAWYGLGLTIVIIVLFHATRGAQHLLKKHLRESTQDLRYNDTQSN